MDVIHGSPLTRALPAPLQQLVPWEIESEPVGSKRRRKEMKKRGEKSWKRNRKHSEDERGRSSQSVMTTETNGKATFLLPPPWRVTHLQANLGWVDLDFGCSTVCPILLGLVEIWQKRLSSRENWWNVPNQSQPDPGLPGVGSPCRRLCIHS